MTDKKRDNDHMVGQIKIDLPAKFSGKDPNYEFDGFCKRLRNYLCMHNKTYTCVFDYFKTEGSERNTTKGTLRNI